MKYMNLEISTGLKMFFILLIFSLLIGDSLAQSNLNANLYLGQTPPENTPKVLKLSVDQGFFAAERISISRTGEDIYYAQIKGYYPLTGACIKRYTFSEGKWTGPFNLFEGFFAPALSITEDTMYLEGDFTSFISTKKGKSWSKPQRILAKVDSAHYYQATSNGNYYVSARSKTSVGLADWCKIIINEADTTTMSLGRPLNHRGDNLDFFVSKDESYMIVTHPTGLGISYHKKDGGWTNPRNLGPKINFGLGMWGPYVSPDNKYLFYTTGTKKDYSDVNVYWVRIDGLIDSLKYTNLSPYVKTVLKNQTATVQQPFTFTIPENYFIDDDGKTTLTYSATLINGNPLPSWLSFDPSTRSFSGTPIEAGELTIKIMAADSEKAFGLCPLILIIK